MSNPPHLPRRRIDDAIALEGPQQWNIAERYLCESDSYPRVTVRNIPQSDCKIPRMISSLERFRIWTVLLHFGNAWL